MNELKEIFEKYASEGLVKYMINELEATGTTSGHFDYEVKILVHKAIASMSNYTSTFENGELIISKFPTVAPVGKTYLRLGLIPENGKSQNFLTKEFEDGVSVFELVDGKPAIDNLQLIDSFAGRYELPAFIVTGEEISKGHDGEPILTNVNYVEKANVDFTTLTIEALDNAFETKTGAFNKDAKGIHHFLINELEIVYAGFTYSNPKNAFNTKLGKGRNL